MALTEEQKKELDKARKKSASYRTWYDQNKERVAAQRKARYANDPEYRARILENRKKQREREKAQRATREVQGNVIENRKYKTFKVQHDEHGSCVTHFLSIGQIARVLELSVPTLRKWEREEVIPPAMYRSNGGHRLYTIDQVNTIKEVYDRHTKIAEEQGKGWKLTSEFRSDIRTELSQLILGVKLERYSK